jgi:hypothetical protein
MFPIYGLAWLVVPLMRYAIGRRKGKRSGITTAVAPGPSSVTLQFLGLLVGITLLLLALAIPSPWLALISVPFFAVGFAPPLAHLVAVPLGMPRLACGLHRYSGAMGPVHERPGNAALVAARAFMRRPTDEGARFIEAYLKTCLEMGTSGAAASAVIAAWRGDRDQAASIFRLLAETDAPCIVSARRLARRYVLLEALNRRAWTKLPKPEAPHPWFRSRPMGHLFQRAHGLAQAEGASAAAPIAPTFAAHAALLARSPCAVREKDVVAAVLSLDQLRTSPAWRARIEQRALALGLSIEGRSAEDGAMREAEEDVAAVLLAGRLPWLWAPEGPSGDAIRTLVREARLRQAESLVRELARRVRERRDLPEPDEWRAWADAKQACADLQRDGTDASTVFGIAFNAMTAYAVRLVNIRARRVLARDIFHYARSVARAAQATHMMELAEKNVKAIEAYRLPNQPGIEGILLSDRKRVAVWSRSSPVLIPGAIAAFVTFSVLSGAFVFGMVLMLGVVVAISFVMLRLIECEHTADGLVVQGRTGRYVAAPEDILSVQSGPGPLLRIRLQRVPFGLPRRILTITKSNAHARAHAERLRTELRLET